MMEQNRKERMREWMTDITVITLLMLALLIIVPYNVYADDDIAVKNSNNLVLKIVDDESETVIENNVPLAAGPTDNDFVSHAVLGGVLLAICLAYVIYFSRYQNRIFELRREVAEAEARVMRN